MSVQTGMPAGMPTRMSPETFLAASWPRCIRSTTRSPEAVLRATSCRASRTRRSPEPDFTLTGSRAVPTGTSPEPVETLRGPPSRSSVTSPEPDLTCSGAVRRASICDVAGAGLDDGRRRRLRRCRTSPEPVLSVRLAEPALDAEVGGAELGGEPAVVRQGDAHVRSRRAPKKPPRPLLGDHARSRRRAARRRRRRRPSPVTSTTVSSTSRRCDDQVAGAELDEQRDRARGC